jgi:NAD(P)-dependent dehydrogenase (short-subunit alcohol dehydrogenase family)
MARKGHVVYAAMRSPGTADELKDKIAAEKLPVIVTRLDLVDPASIESAVAQIMQELGRLDGLVANAGIGAGSSVEETPLSVAREIFEINYFGNVALLREVTPMWTKGTPPSAPPLYPKTVARLMRFFEVGLRAPGTRHGSTCCVPVMTSVSPTGGRRLSASITTGTEFSSTSGSG